MLERHIIQGRARALAEKERIMQQADVHAQETFIKIPPGVCKELPYASHRIPLLLIHDRVCSTVCSIAFF